VNRGALTPPLIGVLQRLDALAGAALRAVDMQALQSPLARRAADVTPLQRQMIADGLERLQREIAQVMQRHGIEAPARRGGAAQTCRTALHRALEVLQGLVPAASTDEVADETEAELRRIVGQLRLPLEAMLRALDQTDDATSPSGDATLDELQRIVAAHGLAQCRPALAALVERARAHDLMVAVFGRVNAGKSSLVNRLLGVDLLPVGVTPATAVPVWLHQGLRARGRAEFADAAVDEFTPARLAEFAAETMNPGNDKHVTRLLFELPAPRLAQGLTLVDMPGWDGTAPLPPCDLALVLIDAGASLALDEATLVAALRRSGAQVLVLLSKSDRLADDERWKVYGHVTERLWSAVGEELPVFFASSRSSDPALREDWIARGLDPCLARRDQLVGASLARKTEQLRADVIAALRERLAAAGGADTGAALDRVRSQGLAAIAEATRREVPGQAQARRRAARLVDELAHNAAVLLRSSGGKPLELDPLVDAALRARADAAANDVVRELEALAARCADALAQASVEPAPTLLAGVPPALEAAMPRGIELRQARWALLPGRWQVRRALRERGVLREAERALARHAAALAQWRSAALAQLEQRWRDACDAAHDAAGRIAADLARIEAGIGGREGGR
jgi:GTP-binding protein EngB required for normal cell division